MVIPARKRVGSTAAKEQIKETSWFAAYCRVSTETEENKNSSYEVQVAHLQEFYKEKIMNGSLPASLQMMVSPGRNTKSADEFNRMIAECMDGNIER